MARLPDPHAPSYTPVVTHAVLTRFLQGEADVEALLEAWRVERTGDLADAIAAAEALPWIDDFLGCIQSTRWNEGWTFDDKAQEARARNFVAFTHEIATWRAFEPDPRIGAAALDAIWRSDSNNWFRGDQVAHIVPQAKLDDTPSFADHALALLETHADADSPGVLKRTAHLLRIEAACNEAEMASRLWHLAGALRGRFAR